MHIPLDPIYGGLATTASNFNPNTIACRMIGNMLSAACLALAFAALPVAAKGDAEKGKALFYTCTGCHGIADYKNAYPTYRVPKVGGQNEQYLIIALTHYKKGERPHPTMRAQGEGLSDQDIADLAAYLSSLKNAK